MAPSTKKAPKEKAEVDLASYLTKAPTHLVKAFQEWIPEQTGYDPSDEKTKLDAFNKGVKLALNLHKFFQTSDDNKSRAAELKAARAEEAEARAADRASKAEAREATEAERAEKRATREAAAAEKQAARDERTANKATKAPAKKVAPAKVPATKVAAKKVAAKRLPAKKAASGGPLF